MDTTTIHDGTPRTPTDAGPRGASSAAALTDVVEASMLACEASSGCACINEGGDVRLVAVIGDRARLEGVVQARSRAIRDDRTSGVSVWRDAGGEERGRGRFQVVMRDDRPAAGGPAILLVDARAELTPERYRLLVLLARQARLAAGAGAPATPLVNGAAPESSVDACVAEARATEGRRVTAELHAMLGHELSSAALALNAALPGLDGAPACLNAVRAVGGLLQGAVGRCRERMTAGYGVGEASEGFAATLRRISATVAQRGGVKVHVHVASGVGDRLTASSAYHLHHLALDAIVGAVRDSQGSIVVVSIAANANGIVLQVDDDGSGVAGHSLHERRRVESIEAVAHMLGGDVSLRPRHPRGLSVRVRLPSATGIGAAGPAVRRRTALPAERVAAS